MKFVRVSVKHPVYQFAVLSITFSCNYSLNSRSVVGRLLLTRLEEWGRRARTHMAPFVWTFAGTWVDSQTLYSTHCGFRENRAPLDFQPLIFSRKKYVIENVLAENKMRATTSLLVGVYLIPHTYYTLA